MKNFSRIILLLIITIIFLISPRILLLTPFGLMLLTMIMILWCALWIKFSSASVYRYIVDVISLLLVVLLVCVSTTIGYKTVYRTVNQQRYAVMCKNAISSETTSWFIVYKQAGVAYIRLTPTPLKRTQYSPYSGNPMDVFDANWQLQHINNKSK
jgi:hypothetical protein